MRYFTFFFSPNMQSLQNLVYNFPSRASQSGPVMFKCPAAAVSSQWLLCGQHVSRVSINQEWAVAPWWEVGRAAGRQDLSQHLHTHTWLLLRWCELRSCFGTQVCVPNAQRGETSREMFVAGPARRMGSLHSETPYSLMVLGSGRGRNVYRQNVRGEL